MAHFVKNVISRKHHLHALTRQRPIHTRRILDCGLHFRRDRIYCEFLKQKTYLEWLGEPFHATIKYNYLVVIMIACFKV